MPMNKPYTDKEISKAAEAKKAKQKKGGPKGFGGKKKGDNPFAKMMKGK